jgi:hypothetical protein
LKPSKRGNQPRKGALMPALDQIHVIAKNGDALTSAIVTPARATDVDACAVVIGATPIPAALPLFASGLGALGFIGWRRKRKAQAARAAA